MYVCGPTVYDLPHIGHGRYNLVFDVLRRYLLFCGLAVHYVSNITDVDDNIIKRANEQGRTEAEVAAEFEARWWEAMDALGVLRPDETPHATAYIADMVDLVADLLERGVAYETSDGVYLTWTRCRGTGSWRSRAWTRSSRAHGSRKTTRSGRPSTSRCGRRPRRASRRGRRPGAPAVPAGTPSAWSCRSTCSATASTSTAGAGTWPSPITRTSAPRRWPRVGPSPGTGCTTGGSRSTGTKMSKSLGNFTSLTDLLARCDERAYRLLVLRAHYRSPIEVTAPTLADAEKALDRLDGLARRFGLGDLLAGRPRLRGRRAATPPTPTRRRWPRSMPAWTTTWTRPVRWPASSSW